MTIGPTKHSSLHEQIIMLQTQHSYNKLNYQVSQSVHLASLFLARQHAFAFDVILNIHCIDY